MDESPFATRPTKHCPGCVCELPVSDMTEHRDAMEAAEGAAEAIRSLNHTTIRGGYEQPGDVSVVVGALQSMAERLPQALRQAEGWLDNELRQGRIGDDRLGARPGVTTSAAAAALLQASVEADRLADALATAHGQLSHLTGVAD